MYTLLYRALKPSMASHTQTLLDTLDLKLSEIDVESPTQVEQREVEELIARLYRERCGANIVLQLRGCPMTHDMT